MRIKGIFLAVILLVSSGCGGDNERGPNARFTVECIEFACSFDAGTTTSQFATQITFRWNFGDGATASGAKVTHYFENSGDYDITLMAVDPYGRDQVIQSVSVTGNDALAYFEPTRDSISTIMFVAEAAQSLILSGDLIQTKAETAGVPGEDGYNLSCTNEAGVIDVLSWTDVNGNSLIDGSEALEVIPDDCEITSNLYLNSANSLKFVGDFDADNFSVVTPAEFGFGVSTDAYPNWYSRGMLDFDVIRSNGSIDTVQIQSPSYYFLQRDSQNTITDQVFGNMNLIFEFDNASGLLGTISIRDSFGASAISNDILINTALDFDYSGDQPRLLQGEFTLNRGNAVATIALDPDPAYLSIKIDEDGDGTIDISDRFPQSLAVVRWQ